MKRGVLLFAYNNSEIDYVKLAEISATRIKKFLNLPITLVVDNSETVNLNLFDSVVVLPTDKTQKKRFYDGIEYKISLWKNFTRTSAYDITPYDETLVLDVDYLVSTDFLLKCFDSDKDFLIYKNSYDLAGWRSKETFAHINDHASDFFWATVFYFKKTPWTNLFFQLTTYIKNNWEYYRNLYQVDMPNYRNDISFSIALNILNGFDTNNFVGIIPSKLYFVSDRDFLVKINDKHLTFLVQKENELNNYNLLTTSSLDVHVMNKSSILRCVNE